MIKKHQQRKILEILATIEEAQSAELYADCQEGAIKVGEYIESILGEGTKIVGLLEEYHELLYKVSIGESNAKALKRQFIKINNTALDDLKADKIEVAFFPYKASMWDSLESIWLAAKEDPACETYVVPIPGYELNADGSHRKMYYDGDQYPENIPVTDWKKYNVKNRCPDVIFTHYPYDDNANNYTIHPDFYSKNLRMYCERLIHVPYWVINEKIPDYYFILPGVLFAHHTIVQSKAHQGLIVGYYKEFDKKFGWNGQFGKAEEKFVALGSPKFDKVINSKRDDFTLPEKWENLINKPDGSRKKVVFYNTHMFAWIGEGQAYFDKMKYIFDTFKNRDDVILWWRPHPNTELNFRTKKPQLLNAYFDIIKKYIDDGFGIYDDTHDLHRAIFFCDAYFGDYSSITVMFESIKKKENVLLYSDYVYLPNSHTPNHKTIEGAIDNLVPFLSQITLNESPENKICESGLAENLDGSCGWKVWEYVKSEVLK